MGEQTLIKTTAKFQDNKEPIKQRPIIQFDGHEAAQAHLPNTIRSSIESGRDNPFRPDGEIYKSADPIVDYYKFGPNQSRTQSPTDSQLLLNGNNNEEAAASKRKRKTKSKEDDERVGADGARKKACWRKWLCCCCCCGRCFKCCKRDNVNEEQTEGDVMHHHQVEGASAGGKQEKRTKVVVLRDNDDGDAIRPASYNINQSQPTIMLDNNDIKRKKIEEPSEGVGGLLGERVDIESKKGGKEKLSIGTTTNNKSASSKCVVS